MRNIRVASVQYEHRPGDKPANFQKVESFAGAAAAQGAEIVLFPECCLTGYWYLRHLSLQELTELAEPIPGDYSHALLSLSSKFNLTVGAGLIERASDGRLYNSYVVAMPDGRFACHRKLHAFVSAYISSGCEYTVFDSPHDCRLGVLTCYDNNLVENVRIAALMGTDILLAPHQTGGCDSRDLHIMGKVDRRLWDQRLENPEAVEAELRGPKGREWLLRWLPARAHDNGIFVIFSNGVGVDDDEIRTGNAMIIDPYGRILVETWKAGDDMITADLDASLLAHATGRRWIRTRRPDLYQKLAVRTGKEEDTRSVRFDGKGT